MCSSKCLLKNEIELTEKFMSWNDFLKYIRKYVLNNICKEAPRQEKNIEHILGTYIGNKEEHLLKKCIRKVRHIRTAEIIFVIVYNTKKFRITT